MRSLRVSSLQLAVGIFCALMGAIILVAPHQFSFLNDGVLQEYLNVWGLLFLLAGASLVSIIAFAPPRLLVIAMHLFTGSLLLVLAHGFFTTGGWIGVANYSILGLGTGVAGFLPRAWQHHRSSRNLDLFAILVALSATVVGSALLTMRGYLQTVNYFLSASQLVLFGLLFLVSGTILLAAQLLPWLPFASGLNQIAPRFLQAACLLTAGVFGFFLLTAVLPIRTWIAITYYGGFGLGLVGLAFLQPRLLDFVPTSLRTRLALVFGLVAALPLIVTVALVSAQEERSVKAETLARQEDQAIALAKGVADYIGLHQAALDALAAQPDFANLSPDAQLEQLEIFQQAFPDVAAFSSYAADGAPIVRTESSPGVPLTGYWVFETVQRTNQPLRDIFISPALNVPVIFYGVPVRDAAGEFTGMVSFELLLSKITDFLILGNDAADTTAYLVDTTGRVIAHPDRALVPSFTDLSSTPPVQRLLASSRDFDMLAYPATGGEQLVGYARVPELRWSVVVERPATAALRDVHAGRDLAYGVLLLFIFVTTVSGSLLASWLVTPLSSLTHAVSELAAGNPTVPLPRSRITEVDDLAQVFGEMRARLAARTQELLQITGELELRVDERTADMWQANEQLAATNQRLQAVLKALPVAVWIADASGRVLEKNNMVDKIWGEEAPLPLNIEQYRAYKGWWAATGEELKADDWGLARAVAKGEISFGEVIDIRRFDGAPGTILNSAAPIRDANGRITGAVVVAQDITHQRQLERQAQCARSEAQQRSEEMSAIFRSMTDAVVVYGAHGIPLQANPAAVALFGFDPIQAGQAGGEGQFWLCYPDGSQVTEEKLPSRRALAGEVVSGEAYTFTNQAGRRYDIIAMASPIYTGDRLAGAVMVWHDVTDLRQAEEALRRREKEFRTLIDNVPDGITRFALDLRQVYLNPACERIFAIERAAFDGRVSQESGQPDVFVSLAQAMVRQVFKTGRDELLEYRIPSGQGTRYFEARYVPELDESGEVESVLALTREITDRKQAEAALRASEARERAHAAELEAIMNAAPALIWIAHDTEASRITGNRASNEMLHILPGTNLSVTPLEESECPRHYQVLLDGVAVDAQRLPIQLAASQGVEFLGVEEEILFEDGESRRIYGNITPLLNEDGSPRGAVAVFIDITDRVRIEEAVKTYARQLERTNRELQDFAFISSHDLQEPLRKIRAFSERVRVKYQDHIGDEGRDYLDRMGSAAERMQLMIDDLLAYSRVTTKARPFTQVDLASIAQETLSDLDVRIERTAGQVEVGDLPTIEADATQMRQLFQNLIGNALKFHRPHTPPVVKVYGKLVKRSDSATPFLELCVEDNGIGFEEQYLERIFQPFQRLHGRSEYEGTGIGLAICRKIVERHDGSITAHSTPGQGTTFVVILPVKQNKTNDEKAGKEI